MAIRAGFVAALAVDSSRQNIKRRDAVPPRDDPLESERKFPEDTDHVLNNIVALVAELFKVGKGISSGVDFTGEKLRDNVGGEFAFLNAEKNPIGEKIGSMKRWASPMQTKPLPKQFITR